MTIQAFFFLLLIFLSDIIQAITGFAGTVLAMPPSLRLVGEDVAKPVLNLAAALICVYIAIKDRRSIRYKTLLVMLFCVVLGFAAGYGVERLPLDKELLLKLYGLSVSFIAVIYFAMDLKEKAIPSWLLYLCLFLGGVLHSLYVSGGPLVVIYAMKRFKDKDEFRANLSLMWIVLNSILFGTQLGQGLFTPYVSILALLAIAISFLSYFIGKKIAEKTPLPVFMKITYVLLFISGISLLL